MAYWEWLEEEQIQRDLSDVVEAPTGGGYGDRIIMDNTPPRVTANLSAEGVTAADYSAVRASALARGDVYTFTLVGGGTVVGIIEQFQASRIKGLARYNVRVSVRVTA